MTMMLLLLSLLFAQPAITASDAWLPESPAGGTAAVSLVLNNPTMYDIYVVKATSDAAETIELRDGGKPVKEITVPSFGFAALTASGPHLVLMDVKRVLKAGENVTLTLLTDGGITLVITAVVAAR